MSGLQEVKRALPEDFWYSKIRYIVFFGLIILFAVLDPRFLNPDNISNILSITVPYAMAVVGMTFVILAAGIDLSIGSIVFLSGAITVIIANNGGGLFLSLLGGTLGGLAVGMLNGVLIAHFKIVPFLTTLATMSIVRGLTVKFADGGFINLADGNISTLLNQSKVYIFPVTFIVLAGVVVLATLVLKKTKFGWHLYAMGNNYEAAQKSGIKVKRLTFWVYAICGLMAGVSGALQLGMFSAIVPTTGTTQEFMIISATVLGGVSLFGGKGSIWPGAIVGIFIFTIIENAMSVMGANPYFYDIARGIVIFFAIMLDSIRNKGELR